MYICVCVCVCMLTCAWVATRRASPSNKNPRKSSFFIALMCLHTYDIPRVKGVVKGVGFRSTCGTHQGN